MESETMENEEITRRNTALALYMGWKLHDGAWFDGSGGGFPHTTEMLEFHSNWQWLMPVVESIMKKADNGFHLIPSSDGGEWYARFGLRHNCRQPTAIGAAWLCVSDYVLAQQKAV